MISNFRGTQEVLNRLVLRLSVCTVRKNSNYQFDYLGHITLSSQDYQYWSHRDPISDSDSWLPPCYLQNSNKYIKKICWLCDKADCNQLIKPISVSFSRKEKARLGSLSWSVVHDNRSLFLYRVKNSAREINKKPSERERERRKPLPSAPLPSPTKRQSLRILETGIYSQWLTQSRLPLSQFNLHPV